MATILRMDRDDDAVAIPTSLPAVAGLEIERDLALLNVENIRARLANCEEPLEAWDIAQAADAARKAIAARKLGADIVWEAAEFALRARRRVGQLLGEAQRGGDRGNQYTGGKSPNGEMPKLDHNERHRCRAFAAVPQDRFNGYLIERRERFLDNDDRLITPRRAYADLTGKDRAPGDKAVHPIKPSDNWNFGRLWDWADKIEGEGYDEVGYLPGQVYANILHYWTKAGDRVCAPMAGSGMIFRVYEHRDEWMPRAEPWELEIEAFDMVPRGPYRDRIVANDAVESIPATDPDLIVMDIPYFGMCGGVYSDSPRDLGNMAWPVYLDALAALAGNCAAVQGLGQRTVIITAARYVDHKAGNVRLLDEAVVRAFEGAGFTTEDKAFATRRIQQAQNPTMAHLNNRAREVKLMLSDMVVVLVFSAGDGP
jgi:hypothetical protein